MSIFQEFTLDVTAQDIVCHPGQRRPHQEDSCGMYRPSSSDELSKLGAMYLVADGVGGATFGGKASKYAAQRVLHDYYINPTTNPSEQLKKALAAANREIFTFASEQKTGKGMGTTLVAAVIKGATLFVANVGDSRAYRIRGGRASQITKDHSLMQQLLDTGDLSPEQAITFSKKNVLIRCLGAEEDVHVDIFENNIQEGDTIVLCSDGFHNYLREQQELVDLIDVSQRANDISQRLISLANERGGSDNISVLVIKVLGIGVSELEDELATMVPVRLRPPGKLEPDFIRKRHEWSSLQKQRMWLGILVLLGLLVAGLYPFVFRVMPLMRNWFAR